MHHFFVKEEYIREGRAYITGEDYRHAVNALRIRSGEKLRISDGAGRDYACIAEETVVLEDGEKALALLLEGEEESRELPAEVWLFQGLPKSDKLDLIIQKATELGVSHIVPVEMKNCVAKLEKSKAENRRKRWQAVAESAAKQSGRSMVPEIHLPVSFPEAARMAASLDVSLLPYEKAEGLTTLSEAIISFLPGRSIGVIIGPEGGFDPMEVKLAEARGILTVSLGKRILRTETAAIAALSLVMIRLEIAEEQDFT